MTWDVVAALSVLLGVDLSYDPRYYDALQRVAVRGEVAALSPDCVDGADLVRARLLEAATWPPTAHRHVLAPGGDATRCALSLIREQRARLDDAYWLHPHQRSIIEVAREELAWRYRVWDALDDAHIFDAQASSYFVRQKLQAVRELIGEDRFWLGAMPSPVPEGLYRRVAP